MMQRAIGDTIDPCPRAFKHFSDPATCWYVSLQEGALNLGKCADLVPNKFVAPYRYLNAFDYANLTSSFAPSDRQYAISRFAGFARVRVFGDGPMHTVVSVRTWLAVLIGSMLFVLQIAWILHPVERLRRARRRRLGQCTSCGYSLLGNLSGVCPECGRRR